MAGFDPRYLQPTPILDAENPSVKGFARQVVAGVTEPVKQAVRLFYAVRDRIRYDPYTPFYRPEHYQASGTLFAGRGFCIPKAALLCALGRACGIPSRIGFATVRNHLTSRQLFKFMGTDLFVYHGYTEFFLLGRWVKATPTFNAALCRRYHVAPLEFDGVHDAMLQEYNHEKQRFIEYVDTHGVYPDVPVKTIVAAWKSAYGVERVSAWVAGLDSGKMAARRFEKEPPR